MSQAGITTYVCAYKFQDKFILIARDSESKINTIIDMTRANQEFRQFLISTYYTDCFTLERIFCGDGSAVDWILDNFDDYLDNNQLIDDDFDQILDHAKNLKPTKKISHDDISHIIKYRENMIKYTTLVSAFWGRDEAMLLKLDDDNLQRLAEVLIRDHTIEIKSLEECKN